MGNGLAGAMVGLIGIAVAADIAGKVINKSYKNVGMKPMRYKKVKKIKFI